MTPVKASFCVCVKLNINHDCNHHVYIYTTKNIKKQIQVISQVHCLFFSIWRKVQTILLDWWEIGSSYLDIAKDKPYQNSIEFTAEIKKKKNNREWMRVYVNE